MSSLGPGFLVKRYLVHNEKIKLTSQWSRLSDSVVTKTFRTNEYLVHKGVDWLMSSGRARQDDGLSRP